MVPIVLVNGVQPFTGTADSVYDARELTQESTTRAGGLTQGFAYDAGGNATLFGQSSLSFSSDLNDERTNLVYSEVTSSFGYDLDGNLTNYNGTALTFDDENQLTGVGTVGMGYFPDGLRAWKQGANGVAFYLYDGSTPVVELGQSGNVTAVNTFGPTGLLSRLSTNTLAPNVFYTFDLLGYPIQRLDGSGNFLSTSIFSAYGDQSQFASLTADGDPYNGYRSQFGYYTDVETAVRTN